MKMTQDIDYSIEYINVSSNRYSHCLDANKELICFGTKHSIALYCLQRLKVFKLLNGHKNRVNSVKVVTNNSDLLISSSADKTSMIWHLKTYEILYKLLGHKESIILSYCLQLDDKSLLSLSSSTDKSIKIWINDKQINELTVNNFIFDLKVCKNVNIFDDIILITVGANETINLYQFNESSYQINCLIEIKGHEDWIRSIDIFETINNRLMIATSSQDCFIRVHQIYKIDEKQSDINHLTFSLQTKDYQQNYQVQLETILAGHEGWVSQVCWQCVSQDKLQLLSSSMDKTMILWESPNNESLGDLWTENLRVGEIGGNTLGFLGCVSIPALNLIVGHSFNGALHIWKCSDNEWKPCVPISGHFDEVTDICWEPKGEYLLSCSSDETTRLHSVWVKDNNTISWHELARPQIHGYAIKCIAMIDRHSFVSGADEKVLRLFKATKCFSNSLKLISSVDNTDVLNECDVAYSATVPTLGLSNTAVYSAEEVEHDFKPTTLEVPPTEETLLQNTLWPEIHKLYGHVFEIFSLAINSNGTVIASASKATKAEHADIILWDTINAKQICKLSSHQLTVTRIRFSRDDRYILSVSRDRTWTLFEKQSDGDCYRRIGHSLKHNEIKVLYFGQLIPNK
ncbi:elongator complex protein 2-like isoform X2 [Oppia nitens]|uniref:elongator complex protein 2-like isoform X2 n=1 Tax=Oppia nitens TaxID=1686743 RepID=UPI0023DCDFF7|nr:elongator complex protein 2-like isoform X2 [Oppia nitens]